MKFQQSYFGPQQYVAPGGQAYFGSEPLPSISQKGGANIEQPIVPLRELGQSVTEGQRFGTFIQSATAALRTGAGSIELQTQMGGGAEPVGAESYGRESREALRELARANEITYSAIHTPTNIGNMSGFNQQRGSFEDSMRQKELEEVRSAIKFAGDVSLGGGVVIHTGEFERPMFDADWNIHGKWKDSIRAYEEEKNRAVKPLVDIRTGRLISQVQMNQIVPRAKWNRATESYEHVDTRTGERYYVTGESRPGAEDGDYIDYEGNRLERKERVPKYDPDKNSFIIEQIGWEDFKKDAREINAEREREAGRPLNAWEKVTPEEAFLFATTETQEKISKGWAGQYANDLKVIFADLENVKKAREFYADLERKMPPDQVWKIMERDDGSIIARHSHIAAQRFVPGGDLKKPSEILDRVINDIRDDINTRKEMVTGQLQQAEEQAIQRKYAVAASKYALRQSMKSYAELGIDAMQETHTNPHVQRDIFVAPENIFPEMGYGSHPDELINLVHNARRQMVNYLTSKKIEDPSGHLDDQGNPISVENPYYKPNISREQAEKEARQHIRATFDTQHLAMWMNNFPAKPGESERNRKERFKSWYLDQVDKIAKADIVGNVHLVDAIGGSHQHLPPGQGELPLKETISRLRKAGYKGPITSEAHGEERFGAGRIMVETWREFGVPINRYPGGGSSGMFGPTFGQIQHGFYGQNAAPYFIFGAYSPSNDWTLWSEVPME